MPQPAMLRITSAPNYIADAMKGNIIIIIIIILNNNLVTRSVLAHMLEH